MPAANENETTSEETGGPPAGPSPVGKRSADSQYEFTPGENKVIGQLAMKMHFVGLFLLAMGMLVIGIGVLEFHSGAFISAGPILSGSLTCVVGLWTQRASTSFSYVVRTQGRDISHLMDALDDLRKLYNFQFWLVMLALLLALTGLWFAWLGYGEIGT
jgi:hypothetical protein